MLIDDLKRRSNHPHLRKVTVRIPLDYYRVLGLTPQGTEEKLDQFFEDRRRQLPRREYSDAAIASRQRLLERAYRVLSDTQQRLDYDQQFFANIPFDESESVFDPETFSLEESSPTLTTPLVEIPKEEQIGALMILAELGDYEQVRDLGEEILSFTPLSSENAEFIQDTHLCLALAAWELCREQWQQSAYERAGQLADQAGEYIANYSQFVKLKEKIRQESYLLRPYRILELLAHPDPLSPQRQQGLRFLKSLLEDRQGIDGQGEDHSGLTVENFLRFIQQARKYLTLKEQIELFSVESQRPSYVATYLAVYALIAQGVSEKNPSSIVRGSQLLTTLNKHQDVALETAICALLLGQTKVANEALQQSQDRESLEFIQQQSQGSPDWLPGLYVYGKQWLEMDVFPHFLDLAHQKVSLTEYFADENVVTYLESYLEDSPLSQPEPQVEVKQPVGVAMASALKDNFPSPSPRRPSRRRPSRKPKMRYTEVSGKPQIITAATVPSPSYYVESSETLENPVILPNQPQTTPKTAKIGETVRPMRRKKKVRRKQKLNLKRLFLLVGVIGSIGLLGLGVKGLQLGNSPVSKLEADGVEVSLDQPSVEIPPENARIILPTGQLTLIGAKDIIEAWLSSKAQAFGEQHQIEELSRILSAPLVNTWVNRAKNLKNSQSYWQYQHEVQVKDLKTEGDGKRAVVDAQVKEIANLYEKGGVNPGRSYEETLNVRYTLTQQEGQWLVSSIQVLN